jgi:superfamily II DNA or RNA helicase
MAKSTYRGPESKQDVEDLEAYFDDLWQNRVHGLDVSSLGETSQKILEESSRTENLKDLIEDAQRVFRESKSLKNNKTSTSKILMKHQIDVIKSWEQSSCIGIVDHATGSGKTITALKVMSEWIKTGRPALVIVPSTLLQKQWKAEISQEIGISPLMVGGENANRSNWMMTLSDNTRIDRDFGPRITLAVLASASGRDFVQRLKVSQDLLVVADEVHTTGQSQSRDLLDKLCLAGARLGLSATYSRYGDEEGTKKIEECFGKPLLPKFTISDAIKAGRLVPYDYHFGKVALTSTEMMAYEEVSEEIKRIYARESDKTEFSKFSLYLKKLIFKRAKILKSAERKVYFAKDVIQANYKSSDRWLVYCDDSNQMESLEKLLSGLRVPVLKYFDAMAGDKSETLRVFAQEGGVLLAIKCLDEGIDIPSATHALILASSQNPREYIQRRGRVLRADQSSGKRKAVIWDTVAVDEDGVPMTEVELVRMQEFAGDATNSMVHVELLDLISQYNTKRGGSITFITEDDLENYGDQDIVTL